MDFFNTTNTLQYFSSGQYARFDFFAKLYWIVKGYANNKELIKSLGDSGRAYENETIVENDSAILFIEREICIIIRNGRDCISRICAKL